MLKPLPYSWRLSRYEPELRAKDAEWQSWTDVSDVGQVFNGLPLTMEEYVRVENLYVDAATRFASEFPAQQFRVVYLGVQRDGFALREGQSLVRSDIAPVVRGNLQGSLDCAVVSSDGGFQITFGFDLYMYLAAHMSCDRAVMEIEQAGLRVEHGVPLAQWEQDE